jgi:aspartyl protease family protein
MQEDPFQETNNTKTIGSGMTIAAWIFVLVIATLYFDRFLDAQHNPNQQVQYAENSEAREVILQRNRQGHYLSAGKINGHKVSFLLDTGATNVSIPERIANALRLQRGAEIEVVTANGKIPVYMTKLDHIQIGNIVLNNVRASINPYMDEDEILLGMTFLKHLEFSQRGDQLILRQYNQELQTGND